MIILLSIFGFFSSLGLLFWCFFAPFAGTAATLVSEIEKAKDKKKES